MQITTGFGYYKDGDGNIVSKFVLPIGNHPDPAGMIVTEVVDQAALDAIQLYIPPAPAPSINALISQRSIQLSIQSLQLDGTITSDDATKALTKLAPVMAAQVVNNANLQTAKPA